MESVLDSDDTDVVGRRIAAAIIDAIIVTVIFFVMTLVFGDSQSTTSEDGSESLSFNLSGIPFIATLVVVLAYYILLEAMNKGQTLGKLVTGVRVVSRDGSTLTLGKSAIRNVLRLVDNFPYVLPALGLILIIMSQNHQRIGDTAARTFVIRA